MAGHKANSHRDFWAPTAKEKLPSCHVEQPRDSLRVPRSPSTSAMPPSPPPGASTRCKSQISGEDERNQGTGSLDTQL